MSKSFHFVCRIAMDLIFQTHGFQACVVLVLASALLTACGKKETISNSPAPASEAQENTAPGPAQTPAEPTVIQPSDDGNMDSILAQLTRELHRTMIGRRLNRNFDEFVAIRNLQVPPPPSGKKYAISPKWKVILVKN